MQTDRAAGTLPAATSRGYWALFLLALTSTCALIGYWLWQARSQVLEQARTDSSNLAWILEAQIDATLRRADSELMRLSSRIPSAALHQASVPAWREHWTHELASHKFQFPEISNFYFFDASGQLLYASDPTLPTFSVATGPHFKYLRDHPSADLAFSDVIFNRFTGRPTMVIARALRNQEGRFLGMAAALLDFSHFQTLFDSINPGPNALIVLRKTEGHRLVLRRPVLMEEYNKSVRGPLTERLTAGEKVGNLRFVSPLDGSLRTATFRVLPNYPFYISLAIADEDVLAPWRRQALYSTLAAAAMLGVLAWLLLQLRRAELRRSEMLRNLQERERSLVEAKIAAEAANVAKSTFLASMSHELRTPLNAVLGYAQLLGMDERADPQVRENAGEIEKAGQHLLSLVNDVLDLARIESGRLDMSIGDVAIGDVLDECQRLIQPRAQEYGITLDVNPAPALLRVDRLRLRQVLLNLLSNAVKYNRKGGQVSVRGTAQPPNRYRITVTDTGPGIPAQRLGELFKPFSRMGAERSAIEGTGIGLVITKSLVELMDGSIGVASTPGTGSTFWVEFPMADPAPDGVPGRTP